MAMTRIAGKAPLRSGPTISDVAALAGVNKTTVSVVLNGNRSGTRVSEATRVRIQRAASELGYQANAIARGLAQGRMNMLGVLFSGFEVVVLNNYYAVGILQGAMWAAANADFDVVLFTKPAEDPHSNSVVRDRRTDGFLVVDPVIDSPAIEDLAALGLPLVAVASGARDRAVPSVDVDNAFGARLAAEHLLSLGHRRIAHLTGESNQYAVSERCESYKKTLNDAGISVPDDDVIWARFGDGSHYRAAVALLSRPERPTAILAAGDVIALTVMEAARNLGISVPGQLSVVGFDDITAAPMVTPPLTTVRQPLMAIGDTATMQLLSLIRGEPVPAHSTLIAPELVIRGSTAPVPSK
jgi:LacI family transcriptional regulator